MGDSLTVIAPERAASIILLIRGQRVILDRDLAMLYGVETRALNRAVRRNLDRFPRDFMFELSAAEMNGLKKRLGTEGWAMLSGVLNSPRAIAANIEIMRAFVGLRQLLASNEQLARKLRALERNYDSQFKVVFDAIRALMEPAEDPEPEKSPIGFRAG